MVPTNYRDFRKLSILDTFNTNSFCKKCSFLHKLYVFLWIYWLEFYPWKFWWSWSSTQWTCHDNCIVVVTNNVKMSFTTSRPPPTRNSFQGSLSPAIISPDVTVWWVGKGKLCHLQIANKGSSILSMHHHVVFVDIAPLCRDWLGGLCKV